MSKSKKAVAEISLIFSIIIASLFPVLTIIVYRGSLSPLATMTGCYLVAALFFAVLLTVQKKWKKNLKKVSALKDVFIANLIIAIIVQFLFFISLKYTSAQNYSLLGLTEVAFSFFIVGFISKKEPISRSHLFGAMLMLFSAGLIFLRDLSALNVGDALILIAVIIAPIGNIFTKRALHQISLPYLLFLRSLTAFIVFFIASLIFEGPISSADLMQSFPYFLFSGLVYFGVRKMIFLFACKKISVTHAISFNSLKPVFVFIFAWLLLGEAPSWVQLVAIIPSFIGLHILSRAKQKKTRYGFEESFTI